MYESELAAILGSGQSLKQKRRRQKRKLQLPERYTCRWSAWRGPVGARSFGLGFDDLSRFFRGFKFAFERVGTQVSVRKRKRAPTKASKKKKTKKLRDKKKIFTAKVKNAKAPQRRQANQVPRHFDKHRPVRGRVSGHGH